MADQLETSVEAILLGNNIKQQAKQLIAVGADKVYLDNEPELEVYQPEPYTKAVCIRLPVFLIFRQSCRRLIKNR